MKTTQKMIHNYLNEIDTIDCTNWTNEDYDKTIAKEGWFDEVARSYGTYGCNGLVMMGRKTGFYYVVPSRCSALFCFNW